MVLADFGAEVLRPVQGEPHPLEALPASRMWRRGTFTVNLDPEKEAERFSRLCAAADVLICSRRRWIGSRLEALRVSHPHLVICAVSSAAADDPRAALPAYEHLLAALSGRMNTFSGCADRDGPVFSALQAGVHACAQSVVSGVLAALIARARDGQGCLVQTSLLEALLAYEQGAMIGEQFRDRFGQLVDGLPSAQPTAPMPTLHYLPAQAEDRRWVQLGNLLPHLFDNFLVATDLFEILADPEFDSAQMQLPEPKREAFRDRMFERLQEKPAEEWLTLFAENGGVAAAAVQSTQDALDDPDIVANGHVIERGDGCQLGPLARLIDTPASPGFGVLDGAEVLARWLAAPRPAVANAERTELPLAGVKVVEIATIIAAPFGASLLAEMGADVIKVEPVGGDPYRGMAGGIGAARVNLGKRSICVNLKDPDGQAVVQSLVGEADVLIHNFRPGVPEKLGIGYDVVSKLNPRIVYLQSNGYGPDGPGAHRPSTHPIPGAAMGGVFFQMGGRLPDHLLSLDEARDWSRRLMRANEVNPDPNTALVVASSALLALAARLRTGRGQQVFVDMFGANAYANADDFLSFPDKPARFAPDAELMGLSNGYRLYRCKDAGWVFLALVLESELRAFQALTAVDVETTEAMEALFAGRTSTDWEAFFNGTKVACVRADVGLPKDFWRKPEQARYTLSSEHPEWGAFRRPGPLVRFDVLPPAVLHPPVEGQHTRELLQAAGMTEKAIDALMSDGIVS